MRHSIWMGALALAAIIAGVIRFTSDAPDEGHRASQSALEASHGAASGAPESGIQPDSVSPTKSGPQPARPTASAIPDDPRLAALMTSPDNGFIEFVVGPEGKVIKEIDKNPSSPSFEKPLREYLYSGDRVIGLSSYHYTGDQVQVTKTAVSYHPDGSVDEYLQSTSYE